MLQAFTIAVVAAISLPIGAAIGIFGRPSRGILAAILSFGSGALIAAVSFELIEEAAEVAEHGHVLAVLPVGTGLVLGALTFLGLNRLLDHMGGFLRKGGTFGAAVREKKEHEAQEILDQLSTVGIMHALPPEEIQAIVPHVQRTSAAAGTPIVRKGEDGDALYLVVGGELEVLADGASGDRPAEAIATLRTGDAFGEMALLTGEPRSHTVQASTDVRLLRIAKEDFDRVLATSPRLSVTVTKLAAERMGGAPGEDISDEEARRWRRLAMRSLEHGTMTATTVEEHEIAAEAGGGAALGIYLGLTLDGISESIAIGALLKPDEPVSLAFIAAVFISNLPEAMSSAALMRRLGFGAPRLVGMWGGIVLVSGLAAAIGNVVFAGASPFVLATLLAFTAGAILDMLAETAMPEAYEHGGAIVGICTVLGFLVSYYIGTL